MTYQLSNRIRIGGHIRNLNILVIEIIPYVYLLPFEIRESLKTHACFDDMLSHLNHIDVSMVKFLVLGDLIQEMCVQICLASFIPSSRVQCQNSI